MLPGSAGSASIPANGVCMTDRYVRVAVGADYLEAAPMRGAQTGGADETLAWP